VAPLNNPIGSVPQVPAGAKAAARYINAHGGVGPEHQPLVVKVCNTGGTPQGDVQCGQQAAGDKAAIAVIDPTPIYNPDGFTAALEKSHLPAINPYIATTSQLKSPMSFPLYSSNLSAAACAVLGAKAAGVKRVAFASIDLPIAVANAQTAAAAAKKAGLTVTANESFPLTASDLSPYVKSLQGGNPQLVVITSQPNLVGEFIQSSQALGAQWNYCAQDGITVYQQMVGLGAVADKLYLAAAFPEVGQPSSNPLITAFRAQASAEAASGDSDASLNPAATPLDTFESWLSTQVVVQVASKMSGTITRSNFLAALNHATIKFPGVLPTIDFSKPGTDPQFPRLFNTTMFIKRWHSDTKSQAPVKSVPPTQMDQLVN
jgi:ABC-type branched-subunit amino acid transport system substrate-binding protein